MKKLYPLLGLLVLVCVIQACSPKQEKTATLSVTTTAEGPFFAGPNSLMHLYEVDLAALLKDENITKDQLSSITLTKATASLLPKDSLTLSAFSSATLQVVADDEPMTSIAVANPIASEGTSVELTVSKEADLAPFFKQDQFTLLIDWDFVEDDYREQLGTVVELEMLVEY